MQTLSACHAVMETTSARRANLGPSAAGLKLSRIAICSRASRVNIHKQQHHHSPSGCAFLRDQLQVRGADPLLVAKKEARPQIWGRRAAPIFGPAQASASASSDAKTSHSPRRTNAAKMRPLRQKPDTEVSHAPRRTRRAKNNTLFLRCRLKLCTAEAPPAAATFLQPRADLKAARAKSGKTNVSELQETPLQTPALLPPSRPPSFNVANGNARKAS